MTITKVIKALYVKLGGSLTDTISGIADGAPVSSYSVISDCIKALYVLYGGDLSEVYSGISDVAVKDYTTSAKAIAALAKVISKGITPTGTIEITENGEYDITDYAEADVNVEGITVNESYDISEGTLNSATVELEGDVTAHIPDGVVTLGAGAFTSNRIIKSVIVPDSVTSIGNSAFIGCDTLTDIYYTGTQAEWEAITGISGAGIPEGATIHYEYAPS